MTTDIWKTDSFINQNIPFLFNKEIIEYDMKDAGFSLTQEYQLLPQSTIEKLKKYKKETRKIELGKIQRKDKEFTKRQKEAFAEARKLFFGANQLNTEDIISVKKDAIFAIKNCRVQEFGKYINFRPKNSYTSYIQLAKRMELYYNPLNMSVKGIDDNVLKNHEEYMLHFIKLFFHKMETDEPANVIEFTKRFMDKYKRKELEVGYYRQFDQKSRFITLDGEPFEEYWEENKDELDITYNFFNILIKLIQIPL